MVATGAGAGYIASMTVRFDNVGKALRLLREKQGRSQKELAQIAGITSAMLSNYETGEKKPSLDSLGKVLDALGLYLGKLDDALDVVNDRPTLRERENRFGFDPAAAAGAEGDGEGGDLDLERFLGVHGELPSDLERGFSEMIRGFRQIARHMYRTLADGSRR
jgi:transcriptional regulator with XRE-family HTH domain